MTPIEVSDFADFPDNSVFSNPGDIVPIYATNAVSEPTGSSTHFVGTAQAWNEWVTGGAENWILYSIIDTSTGKAYSGKVSTAGGSLEWAPDGSITTATGANFPQKLLSNFTAVFDKIGEGDTLMVLMNIVGTGTAMSNGGNMIGYLQVGNSMLNKEQTLYYGRDIDDMSIVQVLAELNSFDVDGAEFTFYTDDPAGILDATLIKVYKLPK